MQLFSTLGELNVNLWESMGFIIYSTQKASTLGDLKVNLWESMGVCSTPKMVEAYLLYYLVGDIQENCLSLPL